MAAETWTNIMPSMALAGTLLSGVDAASAEEPSARVVIDQARLASWGSAGVGGGKLISEGREPEGSIGGPGAVGRPLPGEAGLGGSLA